MSRPVYQDTHCTLYAGDALDVLRQLPDASVQTCVTSPPYYGLRDYQTATWHGGDAECDHSFKNARNDADFNERTQEQYGKFSPVMTTPSKLQYRDTCGKCGAKRVDSQLGLEPTPDEYVANMVAVFREVRRVLRDDGTVWLNLGSSYASSYVVSEDVKIREDISDEEKVYVCSELAELFSLWASVRSSRNQAALSERHEEGCSQGYVSPLLQRTSEGSLSEQSRDTQEATGVIESFTSEAQSSQECKHNGASPEIESPCFDSTWRTLRVLRRSNSSVSYTGPHQWWRQKTPRTSRTHTQVVSGSRVGGLPEGQISSSLLELQCSDWDLGLLPSLSIKQSVIPPHLLKFFRPRDVHKPKDLIDIPNMVAQALRVDGWYLRSDIIWAKTNPLPESVSDRPTKAHEYIFMLSKQQRYYYDADAIREPHSPDGRKDTVYKGSVKLSSLPNAGTLRTVGSERWPNDGRNRRSVWTVSTQPYSGAHFACFPPKLIEPCILAGAPEGGVVLDPFIGSGTTAVVAKRLGRRCIGIDLSETYLRELAIPRLYQQALPLEATP